VPPAAVAVKVRAVPGGCGLVLFAVKLVRERGPKAKVAVTF
jgi:hypothetical protein